MAALRLLMVVLSVFSAAFFGAAAATHPPADPGHAVTQAATVHSDCCPDSAEHRPSCHAVLAVLPSMTCDGCGPDLVARVGFDRAALPTGILPPGLLEPPRAL